jgi:hypothetical protein
MTHDLDGVIAQLESAVADLDAYAFDRLREAVAEGARQRPDWDKQVTQARRAVEKAVHLLRRV